MITNCKYSMPGTLLKPVAAYVYQIRKKLAYLKFWEFSSRMFVMIMIKAIWRIYKLNRATVQAATLRLRTAKQ